MEKDTKNVVIIAVSIIIGLSILGLFYYLAQTRVTSSNELVSGEVSQNRDIQDADDVSVSDTSTKAPGSQSNFYNENVCADRALTYFNVQKQENLGYWNSSSYTSHYNSSKNKCYVAITATANQYFSYQIADSMSGTMQGLVNVGLDASGAPNTTNVIACITPTGDCSSYEEFLSKVAYLMRE